MREERRTLMTSLQTKPYMLEGDARQVLETLGLHVSVKAATEQTGGAFNLFEVTAPTNFATPMHIHYAEDVVVILLEGALTVYWGDDDRKEAGAGSYFFQPRGMPHGFRVRGDAPARALYMTIPAGFDDFLREPGLHADGAQIVRAAARYKIEILGPLPD